MDLACLQLIFLMMVWNVDKQSTIVSLVFQLDWACVFTNCWQDPIKDANAAAKAILALEGVVDHGFFLNMASVVIIAGSDGVTVQTKNT